MRLADSLACFFALSFVLALSEAQTVNMNRPEDVPTTKARTPRNLACLRLNSRRTPRNSRTSQAPSPQASIASTRDFCPKTLGRN